MISMNQQQVQPNRRALNLNKASLSSALRSALGVVIGTALALSFSCGQAHAASVNLEPEVESNVWEENDQEFASVTLNGKELITFKSSASGESAEDKAESLADKLQELLKDEKLDGAKLSPAVEGQLAAIHVDGANVLKFEAPTDASGNGTGALETSLKVVNTIRTVLGEQPIPATFLKMAEAQGADQAFLACMTPHTAPGSGNFSADFSGHASWYGGKFHGRRTSNGDVFNMNGLTAAHRTLPFGTKLLVMNRRTGDSCVVQVNDRGPFVDDRIIDLSRGAAEKLNMLSSGVAMVDCRVIDE
jgi:rare lipoprotein A